METLFSDESSVSSAILMRFTDPTRKDHQEIRRIIFGIAHGDHLPVSPTPLAYMDATRSLLHQISSSSSSKTPHDTMVIQALFSILSALIPLVPPLILIDKIKSAHLVIDPVFIFLRIHCSWLTDEALKLGLQCIVQLLDIHRLCNSPWSHASHLFKYLLGFSTSPPPRLRDSSSQAIGQVLDSFRKSPRFLEAASEDLVGLFGKWWLPVLSDGNAFAPGGGARECCYVMDVMNKCIVSMSAKFKIAILSYFKAILQLVLEMQAHRPAITRGIETCLERFCLQPTTDVPPELLLDLLCLVSISVCRKISDGHQVPTTASLLKNGVAKVYSSNGGICASRLPLVFDALKILMGESVKVDMGQMEKEIEAAADAFKCLIHACIDQVLIVQEPTVVEKLCSIVQSLLDYHRTKAPALSMLLAFEVVWTMFHKLGACASYFMRATLESLAKMHRLADEEFPFRKQVTLLLGALLKEKCGLNDANIVALLPQGQLMTLLADYRGLNSNKKLELSHRRKRDEEFVPGDCSAEMRAQAAIYGEAQMTKRIKLR